MPFTVSIEPSNNQALSDAQISEFEERLARIASGYQNVARVVRITRELDEGQLSAASKVAITYSLAGQDLCSELKTRAFTGLVCCVRPGIELEYDGSSGNVILRVPGVGAKLNTCDTLG